MSRLNIVLLIALIASGLYLVQVSFQSRQLFAELDKARNLQRALDIEHEKLQAERQAQATPLRVERTARERLSMRGATPGITEYVTLPAGEGR
jgi:cell division protein FtsL